MIVVVRSLNPWMIEIVVRSRIHAVVGEIKERRKSECWQSEQRMRMKLKWMKHEIEWEV